METATEEIKVLGKMLTATRIEDEHRLSQIIKDLIRIQEEAGVKTGAVQGSESVDSGEVKGQTIGGEAVAAFCKTLFECIGIASINAIFKHEEQAHPDIITTRGRYCDISDMLDKCEAEIQEQLETLLKNGRNNRNET